MLTRQQQRIVRIVGFMDGHAIRHACSCGQSHRVLLDHFEERDGKFMPKRVVELQCAQFYYWLRELKDLSIDVNLSVRAGLLSRIYASVYTWLLLKWLNR
jgi:EAL domain-containing protein (putative c-di-GMP-specific phosphodiesterase class I)